MKILDNHVHTHFSIDAKDTMEDVIKRAIDIGVDYYRSSRIQYRPFFTRYTSIYI